MSLSFSEVTYPRDGDALRIKSISGETSRLTLQRVSHTYAARIAGVRGLFGRIQVVGLQETTMELDKGDRLSVVGPSGCGKTTLLRALAGLLSPTSGQITIFGCSPSTARTEGMLAFVPQFTTLLPWKTVFENVVFPLRSRGCTVDDNAIIQLLTDLGLEAKINSRTYELSGGEAARVSLARAIAFAPELLLLDEPLRSVDNLLHDRILHDLLSFLEIRKITAVLVTHDLVEAVKFSRNALVFCNCGNQPPKLLSLQEGDGVQKLLDCMSNPAA